MKIIREYCKDLNRVVIRTDTYVKTLDHIEMLFAEAKKYFPDLKSDEVDVVVYGGNYYKYTMGIEFNRYSCPNCVEQGYLGSLNEGAFWLIKNTEVTA